MVETLWTRELDKHFLGNGHLLAYDLSVPQIIQNVYLEGPRIPHLVEARGKSIGCSYSCKDKLSGSFAVTQLSQNLSYKLYESNI